MYVSLVLKKSEHYYNDLKQSPVNPLEIRRFLEGAQGIKFPLMCMTSGLG